MALGALLPWVQTWPSSVAADGGPGGGLLVLLAATLLVRALLTGRRGRALWLASASAVWTAACMYVAPGDLVDRGAVEATIAWGAYVALGGALLAIVATAWEGRGMLAVACVLLAGVGAVIGLANLPARSWSPHVDVHWDAPLESIRSTPGYLVRCRKPGTHKPPPLSLAGLGVTRRLLNSATISVCVSNAKAVGPQWCGSQKVTYSPV